MRYIRGLGILLCLLLSIGAYADYILYGGMTVSPDITLSVAYSTCNSTAAARWPGEPGVSFPYLAGAFEFTNWQDSYKVKATNEQDIYSGSNFRTLGNLNALLSSFAGCDTGDKCWHLSIAPTTPPVSSTMFYSGFNSGGSYSPSSTCNGWTTTNQLSSYEALRFQSGIWSHTDFPCDMNSRLLCIWESGATRLPTGSPTTPVPSLVPTTSIPSKSPTTASPTASPSARPTYSPSTTPTQSPVMIIIQDTVSVARKGVETNIEFSYSVSEDITDETLSELGFSVVFVNTTTGRYVSLVDCETLDDELEPDTPITIETFGDGKAHDIACLKYLDLNNTLVEDEFQYYFMWEGRETAMAKLTISLTPPLQTENVTFVGQQYPANLTFVLPISDSLGRNDTIFAQVMTLPVHGELRHALNDSLVKERDIILGNLTYRPKKFYMNQYSTGSNVNHYGEAMAPDTLTYRVMENTSFTFSPIETVALRVRNNLDEIVSISGLTGSMQVIAGEKVDFEDRIQIEDNDNQEYRIAVRLSTLDGSFSVDVDRTELQQTGPDVHGLLTNDCARSLDGGCEEAYFAATPRYLNYLFSKMQFEAYGGATIGGSMSFYFYKPGPDGITDDNFYDMLTTVEPDKTGKIDLVLVTAPTPPPTPLKEVGLFKFIEAFLYVCMIAACLVIAACIGGSIYLCYSGFRYVINTCRCIRDAVPCIPEKYKTPNRGDVTDAGLGSDEDEELREEQKPLVRKIRRPMRLFV